MANEGAGVAGNQPNILLRRFLLKAAFDPADQRTYFGRSDTEFEELDELFSEVRERAGVDLDQGQQWTPPRDLCRDLAAWTAWLDEYGGSPNSPPFDQIYLLVRFAMPLVPTAESEDGAAG
jgi:hypothetical protein